MMGLLDDAIRQHLDLKRRRGADPTDVAKLEHDAFGPIERDEAHEAVVETPALPSEGLRDPAREEADVYGETQDEGFAHPDPPEPQAAAPPPLAAPDSPAPAPAASEQHRGVPQEPSPAVPERPRAAPEPLRPGGSVPLDDIGERTVEFSAFQPEHDPQPDPGSGEHDELEETPEFLQETPEHDRLWFEQKPPRDFDF